MIGFHVNQITDEIEELEEEYSKILKEAENVADYNMTIRIENEK